jgi:RNA polymerase sigma factor (sigma-70 family)
MRPECDFVTLRLVGLPHTTPARVSGPAQFNTTHWSLVLAAREEDSPQAAELLEKLCRSYWYPLYLFVRRSGYDQEAAKDLTQGFFKRLLEKNYLLQVDPEKGKFRSFLLASIKHFLANDWDRTQTKKRGGAYAIISWDDPEVENQVRSASGSELAPDKAFERQWALTLLDQVFHHLRAECAAAGKEELFESLRAYLSGEKSAESYAEAASRLKMTPGSVQVAVHRLRRRYGELLRAEIAQTVRTPAEVDEEIRSLFAALRN